MAATDNNGASKLSERTSKSNLPNLYELLQLEPLDSDSRRIEAAIRELLTRAQHLRESDLPQAKRLARVAEFSKQHLLSQERKQAYDVMWTKAFQPAAMAAEAKGWDISSLEALLPDGDPHAAFDLSAFLRHSAELPEHDLDADFNKLVGLLAGGPTASTTHDQPTPLTDKPVPAAGAPEPLANATLQPSKTATPNLVAPPPASRTKRGQPAGQGRNLATQIRKKRERSWLLTVAGLLISLAVVLAVLFALLPRDSDRPVAPANALATRPNSNLGVTQADAASARPMPQGSGLPKVQGLDSIGADKLNPSPFSGPATPASEPESPGPKPADDSPAMANTSETRLQVDMPLDSDMPALDAMPMQAMPAAANPAANPGVPSPTSADSMPVPAGASTAPTPDIVLSADEQAAWQVTMVEIRDAMGQQDFPLASQLLRAAETQVKTAQQRSQHSRLNALKQLTEDFHSALIQAIQGLSPGASFNVKSTVVAFVDGSEEQIIIRVEGGRSQTHALVDIPPGLAFGLVDLSMDIASPNSLARKAAFSIVHPKRNQLVLNQAEKWMAEAIAAGAIPQDMTEIFSDLP